ncbi:hypothetical protein CEXT_451101 [Caerostris extrusa]|uniref:Uncharacterized protein n=1 Tax=Caerostris extrusa TaxID=172846 RepID=A0AAV4Y3V9_CAEEX|nr:hypothetical protein CEXT_451101 [Caerostris extrusa]
MPTLFFNRWENLFVVASRTNKKRVLMWKKRWQYRWTDAVPVAILRGKKGAKDLHKMARFMHFSCSSQMLLRRKKTSKLRHAFKSF